MFISIQVTYQIFRDRIKVQAESSALRQSRQVSVLVERHRQKGKQGPANLATLFDRLSASYVPSRSEYLILLVGNRIYAKLTTRAIPDLKAGNG